MVSMKTGTSKVSIIFKVDLPNKVTCTLGVGLILEKHKVEKFQVFSTEI